jgi:hypothetical protein
MYLVYRLNVIYYNIIDPSLYSFLTRMDGEG